MAQKRALSTAASPHDDEDVTASDGKVEIFLDDEASVRHGEISYGDMSLFLHPLS
jgi:hypothetical protein